MKKKTAPTRSKSTKPKASAKAKESVMPSSPPSPDRVHSDTDSSLHRCATSPGERHQTLNDAVVNAWANEDISLIQRIESGGRCLWAMWRRSTVPPG